MEEGLAMWDYTSTSMQFYAIFQMISAIEYIYFPFTGISKWTVTNVYAEHKEVF